MTAAPEPLFMVGHDFTFAGVPGGSRRLKFGGEEVEIDELKMLLHAFRITDVAQKDRDLTMSLEPTEESVMMLGLAPDHPLLARFAKAIA
jgi:hypothetical protein